MDTKDPVIEEATFVIDAYRYALDNNLDIRSKEDVEKILKALRPEKSSEEHEEHVEALMPMLDIFDKMTQAELAKRNKIN